MHWDDIEIIPGNRSQEEVLQEINQRLPDFDEQNITGWRVPTAAEVIPINWVAAKQFDALNESTNSFNGYYYCIDANDKLTIFTINGAQTIQSPNFNYTYGNALLPFTTVKFRK